MKRTPPNQGQLRISNTHRSSSCGRRDKRCRRHVRGSIGVEEDVSVFEVLRVGTLLQMFFEGIAPLDR